MKALVYQDYRKVELLEMEEPTIVSPTGVKVKIFGSGICGTDLNIVKGKIPANSGTIIGHEGVGTVVEVGPKVRSVKVGDRVLIDPTQSCGICSYCREGLHCYCENFEDHQVGMTIHGTFAEYYAGEERYVFKIPDTMSWEAAMMVEPLGCVLNSFLKARVKPSDSVLVLGSGAIGSLCQLVGKRLGRLTVGTEVDEYRKSFAANIADYVFHPQELTLEKVLEINNGHKFDIIIDAVGNQLHVALELIGKGGRIIPMGYDDSYEVSFKPTDFINNGVNVIGDVAVHQMISTALKFAQSLPELENMVTSTKKLQDYEGAFNETIGYDMSTGAPRAMTSVKTALIS
ncbi:alcohol dehydrogenase catalytic domain-containing protein [Paenibacillus algorifonticola]|uniref:Alcohol dehydrogenase n=1 Tax=Paenibacillus sp. BIHB 4019 TaxID=1870819 RepID=A0A1B2DL40_9BACL|nr:MULTISPECIES: alcohol dehydrogenase catalytic domain-containing protein [unclassified Paenibacillus]ANY68412.1 alcohol dehydrogenase [Paenibacillus sp. BIHB 4019]KQO17836.1 alcohol dehydrogenase [Paenibacillus sp. Leaf72]